MARARPFTQDFLKTGSKGTFICNICAAPRLVSNPHLDVIFFFTSLFLLKLTAPSMEIKWGNQNLEISLGIIFYVLIYTLGLH